MDFTLKELHTLGIALAMLKGRLEQHDGALFRAMAAVAIEQAEADGVKSPYVPTREDCEALGRRVEDEILKA